MGGESLGWIEVCCLRFKSNKTTSFRRNNCQHQSLERRDAAKKILLTYNNSKQKYGYYWMDKLLLLHSTISPILRVMEKERKCEQKLTDAMVYCLELQLMCSLCVTFAVCLHF